MARSSIFRSAETEGSTASSSCGTAARAEQTPARATTADAPISASRVRTGPRRARVRTDRPTVGPIDFYSFVFFRLYMYKKELECVFFIRFVCLFVFLVGLFFPFVFFPV